MWRGGPSYTANPRPAQVSTAWSARQCGVSGLCRCCSRTRAAGWPRAPLQRHLARETAVSLALRMRFPTRWDPFFTKSTTVADVYHYATEHFEFHRQQLTLDLAGRNTLFRP